MLARKVDSRAMREVNRSIIYDLIQKATQVSRTELAKLSSLTKPTVSASVEDLLTEGVVVEVGFSKSEPTGGRRARLLEFNPDSAAYVGMRIGVRSTTLSLADGLGRVIAHREIETLSTSADACLLQGKEVLDQLLQQSGTPPDRVAALGIAIGGLIESDTGLCRYCPHLNFSDFPLRTRAETIFQLPVVVSNITDAAALAESKIGSQESEQNFVWIYVGTGIGAAVYSEGQLLRGHRGFVGEIGFCKQSLAGPSVEEQASGRALLLLAEARRQESEALQLVNGPLHIRSIILAAETGDPLCIKLIQNAGRALGLSVSHLVNIMNPGQVVLGGGIIEQSELYFQEARSTIVELALGPEVVPVVRTALPGRCVSAGSIYQAMDHAVRSVRLVAS